MIHQAPCKDNRLLIFRKW